MSINGGKKASGVIFLFPVFTIEIRYNKINGVKTLIQEYTSLIEKSQRKSLRKNSRWVNAGKVQKAESPRAKINISVNNQPTFLKEMVEALKIKSNITPKRGNKLSHG